MSLDIKRIFTAVLQYTYSKGETHALMQARINGDLLDLKNNPL